MSVTVAVITDHPLVIAGLRGLLAPLLFDLFASSVDWPARCSDLASTPAVGWPGDDAGLTPRESEMLVMIARGLSNEDIASACHLSINTVKSYIRDAYRKIDVTTRSQAVAWAMGNGLEPAR